MKTSELFRKTLKAYLDKQGHGAQARLADELGIDRNNFNGFLNGRKMISESKREEIAEKLGYSYVDFLILGREMLDKKPESELCHGEKDINKVIESIDEAIESILEHAIEIFEESVTAMFGKEMPFRLTYEIKAVTIATIYNCIARIVNNDMENAINVEQLVRTLKYCDVNYIYSDKDFEDNYAKFKFESAIKMKAGMLSSLYTDIDDEIEDYILRNTDIDDLIKNRDTENAMNIDEKSAISKRVTFIKEYLNKRAA